MITQETIVLVLRSGGDFILQDVLLIAKHINMKWESENKPKIICLWDHVDTVYSLENLELHPLPNKYPGTWSRLQLYSPEMEKYRPFLYVDLDTAIIMSLEKIINLIKNRTQFITLDDFWQKGNLATGLVWFPANSKKIQTVWENRNNANIGSFRMDYFLRRILTPDAFWQDMTELIVDFKPKSKQYLLQLKEGTGLVCFHGHPRIREAFAIEWVRKYIEE